AQRAAPGTTGLQKAWRDGVRQRRRQRRMLWVPAAAVALVSTGGAWMWNRQAGSPSPSRTPVGVVLTASGVSPSTMTTPEGPGPLRVGDAVLLGAQLTIAAPSSISLLEPRVQIRADANTSLRFDDPRTVFFERGRVNFDSGSGGRPA